MEKVMSPWKRTPWPHDKVVWKWFLQFFHNGLLSIDSNNRIGKREVSKLGKSQVELRNLPSPSSSLPKRVYWDIFSKVNDNPQHLITPHHNGGSTIFGRLLKVVDTAQPHLPNTASIHLLRKLGDFQLWMGPMAWKRPAMYPKYKRAVIHLGHQTYQTLWY